MRYFKVFLLSICAIVLASCGASRQTQADYDTLTWNYEIQPTLGQATQGSILVKVWSYCNSKDIDNTQAAKNAVHGVLFKGVPALNTDDARVPAQRPIVTDTDAEAKYEEFFKTFFADGGKYMKYVNFVNNGIPAPGDVIKVKNQYKVGVRVSVAKDALRKEMENAGIVKALGAGF